MGLENRPGESDELDAARCRVGGVNQNYTSPSGTPYHIQIEDLGPVVDRVTEAPVRRLNVIVYANHGEPNARIVHGRDVDFPDVRTRRHNEAIQQRIPELAAETRAVIDRKELQQVERIKAALRAYHLTKDDAAKRFFTEANESFPFLFSRAWRELRGEKAAGGAAPPVEVAAGQEFVYPLDPELRELVLDIERLIEEVGRDLQALRDAGRADDILVQTCRKLVDRARDALSGGEPSELNQRRLDAIRSSLAITWRQIRSRLK